MCQSLNDVITLQRYAFACPAVTGIVVFQCKISGIFSLVFKYEEDKLSTDALIWWRDRLLHGLRKHYSPTYDWERLYPLPIPKTDLEDYFAMPTWLPKLDQRDGTP